MKWDDGAGVGVGVWGGVRERETARGTRREGRREREFVRNVYTYLPTRARAQGESAIPFLYGQSTQATALAAADAKLHLYMRYLVGVGVRGCVCVCVCVCVCGWVGGCVCGIQPPRNPAAAATHGRRVIIVAPPARESC